MFLEIKRVLIRSRELGSLPPEAKADLLDLKESQYKQTG
jgi:hypothetical protein